MNLAAIKQIVSSKTGTQMLKLQKNSPHILFGAGVVGVVATAVTTARSTLKVEDVLIEHQAKTSMINHALKNKDIEKYNERDAQRDKVVVYSQTILKLAQLYAPPIALGVLSIGCLAGSHRILNARNVALTAAFSSMEQAFDKYRQRVIAEFGPEKDRDFRYSTETIEVIEETKRGPQPKDLVRIKTDEDPGLYAVFFDERNKNWERKPEYNLFFLRTAQQMANDKLRARGHIFLNEVFDLLGMDRTPVGSQVGWLYKGDGDGYVDFGFMDPSREDRLLDFVTGREGAILLDFNVDGNIWEKI